MMIILYIQTNIIESDLVDIKNQKAQKQYLDREMKLRDKIKNKVKTIKQQPIKIVQANPSHSFDESHIELQFINCHAKTQLSEIKLIGKWRYGFGYDEKGEMRKLILNCKWFRRTLNDIGEIKNCSNQYQLNLNDIGTTLQVQCIPQSQGLQYQGMPFIKMVGPIDLDLETANECKQLYSSQKAVFSIAFKQINLQSIDQDELESSVGKISLISNRKLQIYGKRVSDSSINSYELLYSGEMFAVGKRSSSNYYPQIVVVDESSKLVILLLDDSNDFVSVEFQSNRVRDVFCLLMKRIREQRINQITMSNEKNKIKQQLSSTMFQQNQQIQQIRQEVKRQDEIISSSVHEQMRVYEQQLRQKQVEQEYLQQKQKQQQTEQQKMELKQQKQVQQQQQKQKLQEGSDSLNEEVKIQQKQQEAVKEIERNEQPMKSQNVQQQVIASINQYPNSQIVHINSDAIVKNEQINVVAYQTPQQQTIQTKPQVNKEGLEIVYSQDEIPAVVLINQQNVTVIENEVQEKEVLKQEIQSVRQNVQQEQPNLQLAVQALQSVQIEHLQQQSPINPRKQQQIINQNAQQHQTAQIITSQLNVTSHSHSHVNEPDNQVLQQIESIQQRTKDELLLNNQHQDRIGVDGGQLQQQESKQIVTNGENKQTTALEIQKKVSEEVECVLGQEQTQLKLSSQEQQYSNIKTIQQLQQTAERQQQHQLPTVDQQSQSRNQLLLCEQLLSNHQYRQQLQQQLRNRLQEELKKQISQLLKQTLKQQVREQLKLQLQEQVRIQLGNKIRTQLESKLKPQVESKLKAQLQTKLQSQIRSKLTPIITLKLQHQLKPQIIQSLSPKIRQQIQHQLKHDLQPKIKKELLQKLKKQLQPKIKQQLQPKIRQQLQSKIRQQLQPKIKKQLEPKMKLQLQKKLRQQLKPIIKHDLQLLIRKQLHNQLQAEIKVLLKKQLTKQIKQLLREQLKPQVKQQLKVELKQQVKQQLKHQLEIQVRQQLRHQLTQQVKQQLRSKLQLQLRDQLKQQLRQQLREQLKRQLTQQVRQSVKQSLRQQVRQQVSEQLKPLVRQEIFKLKVKQLNYNKNIVQIKINTKPKQQQPKIDPQQVIYYKNQHKLLTIANTQLKERIKQMTLKIVILEHEIKQYHPCEIAKHVRQHPKQKQFAKLQRQQQHYQANNRAQSHIVKHTHDANQSNAINNNNNTHINTNTTNTPTKLTPYQQLEQQLNKSRTQNQQLTIRNNFIITQKQALEEELMRYKVDLEELQAQKKHLEKKYDSLYTQLHSTTSNMASNLSQSINQQLGNSIKLINHHHAQQQSPISSPTKSKRDFNIFKSFSSSKQEPTQQQYNMSYSNRKSFTEQTGEQQQSAYMGSSEFEKMSQAIINHYTTQQQLNTARKQLTQLQQQNSTLRSIIHKQKKTSFPLISSTSSSKQLKLQMIQLKKLANRLTEQLTQKNQVIENMRIINKEINSRLVDITKEFHLHKLLENQKLTLTDTQSMIDLSPKK